VLLLDLREVTLIADYFIIATVETERQANAIAEEVIQRLKEKALTKPLGVEGTATSGWLLLDYGDVVIHLFSPKQRAFYQLEELWSNARTVVRIA